MDFTLWNFKDWFEKHGISHSYTISNESVLINHVSFGVDNMEPGIAVISASYNKYNSLFYRSKLSCQNDEIVFPVTPPETVYNICQNMLDFYSQWENEIYELITSDISINKLIETLHKAFPHPIAVIYRKDGLCHVSSDWEITLDGTKLSRLFSTYKPGDISSPVFISSNVFNVNNMICKFEQVSNSMDIYILSYDKKTDMKVGELHLFSVVCQMIQRALCFQVSQQNQYHPLSEWFNHKITTPSLSHSVNLQTLHHIGWDTADFYQIISILSDDQSLTNLFQLKNILTDTNRCCISTSEGLSILLNHRSKTLPETSGELRKIFKICKNKSLFIGISLPFKGLDNVRFYYEQSKHSAEHALAHGEKCCFTLDYLSDYILNHCNTLKNVQTYVHPGISQLIRIDNSSHDDLVRTLYTYLFFGRSCTRTSEKLNIHRNTLRQRLSRISEILPLDDLRGPELEHVMLSLLLTSNSPHT